MAMLAALRSYLEARRGEFGLIGESRREELGLLASMVRRALGGEGGRGVARLVFVCTHNSRRSHAAQLLAAAAAGLCGVDGWDVGCGRVGVGRVRSYSGGTEATAFNPRMVEAMRRAGFQIERESDDENPVFLARAFDDRPAMACFSKVYDQPPNPRGGFIAVMVCDAADEGCPVVRGAAERLAIRYEDPKSSDGTGGEARAYDERCAQIAREMLWAMERVGEAG